jgi:hypothetical protein
MGRVALSRALASSASCCSGGLFMAGPLRGADAA